MTQSQPPITATTHPLPFDKLSPRDFERLCLWLVQREGYEHAKHLGAAGKEQGRDIVAWRKGVSWAFQCKRVQNFYPKDALREVEKVLALPEDQRPEGLVFLVTCDVSTNTRQQARERCEQAGLECDFWTGTELDEKVNRHPDIVEKFFGSAIRKVFQAVVSPWGVAILAVGLILAFVLAAGIFNIPTLQGLLPTPMAFDPASEGQSLIIVADFDDRSEGKYQGVDPAQYIYEELVAQVQEDSLDMRIERLRQVVDDNTAKPTGEAYNAMLVLWGWYDALTITPRMERIRTLSGYRSIEEGLHLSLADPQKVEFSIVTDLPSQATYLALFTLGVDKLTNESGDEALAYFNSALAAIPADVKISINPSEAYFFRGSIYYFETDYEAALADLDKTIALNPEDAAAYINRGSTLVTLGEPEKGTQDYNRVLELGSEYAIEAYVGRGAAYLELEDYQAALADLDQALVLNPDYFGAYINRGIAYSKMDDYEAALTNYERALKLEPNYVDTYINRAFTYQQMKDYEAALADYERALKLEPNDVDIFLNRAFTYQQMKDYEAALTDYERALKLEPKKADAQWGIGQVYGAQGKYEKAIQSYTRAIEIDSQFVNAYLNRGGNYSDIGKYQLALQDYVRVIELDPQNVLVYMYRGITYKKLGDVDRAIADFEHYLELSTDPDWRRWTEEQLRELRGE